MGKTKGPRPAVFLDRDGVLVKEVGYITSREQVELYPGAAEAVAALNRSGWLCVVVTNQSAVARGMLTEAELAGIHCYLKDRLRTEGARLDAVFYCPHFPPDEGDEDKPPYRVRCPCRKPGTGMVDKALGLFNIDTKRSFIIGDRESDMMLGLNAGLSTVLLRTGYGVNYYKKGKERVEPEFVFDDLAEAVGFLLTAPSEFAYLEEVVAERYLSSADKKLLVLVGGQSRSGKSTMVRFLVRQMKLRSIPATVICLDDWILPLDKRRSSRTVLERYPEAAIKKDIITLLAGDSVVIEAYEAASRGLERRPKVVSLPPKGIVFIEGVVALSFEFLRSISETRIFVAVDEQTHRSRFLQYYRDKGLTGDAIARLYEERMCDEYPFVEESRRYAGIVSHSKKD
ncbi:MAG: HAD-IIIA family hydrolase [Bacillota bacterium]